jgi:hypothetical protein
MAASVRTPDSGDCGVRTGDLGQVVGKVGGEWQKDATVGPTSVAKNFSYSTGTSTTTDVAINTSISHPNWSASASNGTEVVHNDSATQGFPVVNLSRLAETDMEEGLFATCQISGESATFPYQVNGGAINRSAPRRTLPTVSLSPTTRTSQSPARPRSPFRWRRPERDRHRRRPFERDRLQYRCHRDIHLE